jgi:hypothetical protein
MQSFDALKPSLGKKVEIVYEYLGESGVKAPVQSNFISSHKNIPAHQTKILRKSKSDTKLNLRYG